MPIEILVSAPNSAAVAYHEVKSATVKFLENSADSVTNVIVHSWKDADTKKGTNLISWQWSFDDLVSVQDFDDIEEALISLPGSPFYAGTIYTEHSGIDVEKARKWAWVKTENARLNTLPLQTSFGAVQCDEASQYEILKAVVMANNLEMMSYPVEIPFTLADNTVVVLDAEMTVSMGFAMGARQQALRARRNELREEIAAAQTVEEVQRITWYLPEVPNEVPA